MKNFYFRFFPSNSDTFYIISYNKDTDIFPVSTLLNCLQNTFGYHSVTSLLTDFAPYYNSHKIYSNCLEQEKINFTQLFSRILNKVKWAIEKSLLGCDKVGYCVIWCNVSW